jgi:hypothetical protein
MKTNEGRVFVDRSRMYRLIDVWLYIYLNVTAYVVMDEAEPLPF